MGLAARDPQASLLVVRGLEENGKHLNGPDRQIIQYGLWTAPNSQRYLTEIQLPVRKETEVPPGSRTGGTLFFT